MNTLDSVNIYRLFSQAYHSLKSKQVWSSLPSHSALFLLLNRCSCTDVISYYVEINSSFNLVLHFSFVILRFHVISWWFSDTTLCKLLGDLFGRNISQHPTSYSLLCIRLLLQALHTSSGYKDSFYAHCTDQYTMCLLACDKVEEPGRKWQRPNNKWYERMPEWNSEWVIFIMKIEFVDIRIRSRCVW